MTDAVIQGVERGTYSRTRYVLCRTTERDEAQSLLDAGLVAGVAPLFHLGAIQGYGVI